jgi:trehalose 6-phosphate phosphatase
MQIHDRLLELARIGPMALYTDIDGTISPIASTPDGAQLYPGAADALHSIRAAGVRVVAITGRAAEDAKRMVGLDDIDYAGNHGFEMLTTAGSIVSEEVIAGSLAVQTAMAEIVARASELPDGTLVEDKVFTGSVHYRLTPDPEKASLILRSVLSEIAARHGIALTGGRLIFELRPKLDINKGVFAANDIRLHHIKTAVFLGDDITDVDGFRAIRALRDSGKIVGGFSVAVCASESLAAVIANSDFQIDGVPKMVQELTLFAAVLKQGMPA